MKKTLWVVGVTLVLGLLSLGLILVDRDGTVRDDPSVEKARADLTFGNSKPTFEIAFSDLWTYEVDSPDDRLPLSREWH